MGTIKDYITERKGVNAVEARFLNMMWVFRETPHTDYGIDGEVEQTINEELTGAKIALQIKSGESYLKENKDGNIVFYIDEWHYKYWLQYSIPVIILFYDETNNRVIWDQVKVANIRNTKKQHKIELSTSKVLTNDSVDELSDIIQAYQPHHFYELTDEFNSFEFSIDCFRELNRSLNLSTDEMQHFHEKMVDLTSSLNTSILISTINTLAQHLKKYNADDYEYLHKGSWYLNKMAQDLPALLYDGYTSRVNEFITIIDLNIIIWRKIMNDMQTLQHPNIPYEARKSARRCNMVIEDRIADFQLVRNEYVECLKNIEARKSK